MLLTIENQIFLELSNIKTTLGFIIFLLVLNVIVTSSIFFKIYSKKETNKKDNSKNNENNEG